MLLYNSGLEELRSDLGIDAWLWLAEPESHLIRPAANARFENCQFMIVIPISKRVTTRLSRMRSILNAGFHCECRRLEDL